jgi:hypothetical protein
MDWFRIGIAALGGLLALGVGPAPAAPCCECLGDIPPWLPRYDLTIDLDPVQHRALVWQRVTWTNRHARTAQQVVLNAYPRYQVPAGEVGFFAKMLELLRVPPGQALDLQLPPMDVTKVTLVDCRLQIADCRLPSDNLQSAICNLQSQELSFTYLPEMPTALVIPLPRPVAQGESVTVEIAFSLRIPNKWGRWGYWDDITFLSNWLPVVAYYDDKGWQPVPFVPWHQPFFNEAGIYSVRYRLPQGYKVACTGSILATTDLGDGRQQVDICACCARDFALLCSPRYQEHLAQAGRVKVRVMALPEHAFYAEVMLRTACEAIETYGKWFGPYPYPEFTIAESYFGWNGNECSGLVMIDERVFALPHLAKGYVEYLIAHEVCHQWWYNVVGTNGYAETWMDEGLATYFSHRLLNRKYGKNNDLLELPRGLRWLPNIGRETYRSYGLYGTIGRGEQTATVQPMSEFGHLVNLFSICYDKGSRVVGMIEERLGEAAFLDFMRTVYARYQYRVLRVADFQRELEAYTGQSWEEFFQNWLYGKGLSDWSVERVSVEKIGHGQGQGHGEENEPPLVADPRARARARSGLYKVTVLLHQKAEIGEQTALGFSLDGSEHYQIRVPILPQVPVLELDEPPGRVEVLADNRVRVEVTLPCKPTQISVDPDQVLVDREPANNHWKTKIRWRLTPLYTTLDENDLTAAHDRWNIIAGPWLYGTAYNDPWFTRSSIVGVRLGAFRTQQLSGGVYAGYRTDFQDIAVGVDLLRDHWPWPHTQVGFNAERNLVAFDDGSAECNRGVLFGRYIFRYGSSLYLPPTEYVELFGSIQNNCLPSLRDPVPGADRFNNQTTAGVHYHLDYLTPYWDPEGGYRIDATYATGIPIFGEERPFNQVSGQASIVRAVPDLGKAVPLLSTGPMQPMFSWLTETRWAARLYAGAALPDDGQLFALGGSQLFRGFDLAERQGSLAWVGSLEWRLPLARRLKVDCLDHVAGLRSVYLVPFYDIGNTYLNGRSQGEAAHALGAGLRLDVAWFSFVERTTVRFDVAKTINYATPLQFWFSVTHPF